MHQARQQPLQELPLAEHDLDLVAHACRHAVAAVVRLRVAHLLDEEPGAAVGVAAADGDEQAEDDGAYAPRTLLSSALIAGTISCRSPITA